MVSKCANPFCNAPFQYLRGGKLFIQGGYISARHDSHYPRTEYFWLCESCARSMTLNLERNKPEVVPLLKRGTQRLVQGTGV